MYLKPLFPDPPVAPETNVHYMLFKRPDQASWPANFTAFIDPVQRQKLTYKDFLERVYDGATALGSPVTSGGLGLEGGVGEIVGILSENVLVSNRKSFITL